MKSVTIYTTPTCVYCLVAKNYFDSKNIHYQEVDITQDEEALKWVVETTHHSAVPVIKIGKRVVVGFDKPTIDELLKE